MSGGDVRTLMLGTAIQIASGLLLGWIALKLLGLGARRELLLPIAFVNSANIPFPLVLANFGSEGLSRAAICYIVTSFLIFSAGVVLLHGAARLKDVAKEPTVWAALIAALLKLSSLELPEAILRTPRLAATAAVPTMLVVFGDSLARTKLVALREGLLVTVLRYATGAAGLAVTLLVLRPEGLVRKILVLYALLPSAVVNVVLARRAGRDAGPLASSVLMATVASVAILPLLLSWLR